MSEFKPGDLVAFRSHPYNAEHTSIKITAYADYTAPIFVVKQIKEEHHDKLTGKLRTPSLWCIYYDSRNGRYQDKWLDSKLVKVIKPGEKDTLLSELNLITQKGNIDIDISARDYDNFIKQSVLDRLVVLRSVEIELDKKKINRTKENGDLVETNHLEFLPPVMSVIGYRYKDEKHKFCEKTGVALIELKCKWYNSNSKTFSEEHFNPSVLYLIKEIQDVIPGNDLLSDAMGLLETNEVLNVPINTPINLEGSNDKIINTIGHADDVLFKHYFYMLNYFDYITQSKQAVRLVKPFIRRQDSEVFATKYPYYSNNSRRQVFDCRFKTGKYYLIVYKDMYERITKRIIKVRENVLFVKDLNIFKSEYTEFADWKPKHDINLFEFKYGRAGTISLSSSKVDVPKNRLPKSISSDENVEILVNANCLLRNGRIRNFNLSRIIEVTEINNGEELFEQLPAKDDDGQE